MLEHNAGDKILECWKDLLPLIGETDELGGFQFLEMRSTLPDELLMFGDKLSMAHGLEVASALFGQRVGRICRKVAGEFQSAERLSKMATSSGMSENFFHKISSRGKSEDLL